jgi:hypothetical protein
MCGREGGRRLGLGLLGMTAMVVMSPEVSSAESVSPATCGKLVCAAEGTSVLFRQGDQLLAEYRYADVRFKPYIKQLFSPQQVNVLLDSPYDHKHHHGLMFAIAVNGVGFWAEEADNGRQVHRSFKTRAAGRDGMDGVAMVENLDWVDTGNGVVAREERTLEASAAQDIDATLLTWRTKLSAADKDKPLALKGDHYYGLGMRFVRAMDKGGRFIFPEGVTFGVLVRGDEHVTPANWCAYTARTEGKDVTAAMFDCPSNPRPAHWFTMTKGFAYMSATLNLWKEPMTLEPGKSLDLCYGVAVWDGKIEPEKIVRLYQRWLELTRP